jgi:hypothetical protein
MSSARWRLARTGIGWALACLIAVLAAPATVRASCGEYVRIGDSEKHPANALPAHGTPDPMTPGNHGSPCHGPTCGQHPVTPLAPTTTLPVHLEEWGWVSHPTHRGTGTPAFLLRAADHGRPVRRPTLVYHPPRLTYASPLA